MVVFLLKIKQEVIKQYFKTMAIHTISHYQDLDSVSNFVKNGKHFKTCEKIIQGPNRFKFKTDLNLKQNYIET